MCHTYSPMTLGNMRANGVRTLGVWCLGRGCDHHRVMDVERYGDDVPVPWFGSRLRCERCGHLGGDGYAKHAMPLPAFKNWRSL